MKALFSSFILSGWQSLNTQLKLCIKRNQNVFVQLNVTINILKVELWPEFHGFNNLL